jgi:hypothetical protein
VEVGRERVLTTAMIAICRSRTFGSAILRDVNEHQRRVWHRMIEAIDAYEAATLNVRFRTHLRKRDFSTILRNDVL